MLCCFKKQPAHKRLHILHFQPESCCQEMSSRTVLMTSADHKAAHPSVCWMCAAHGFAYLGHHSCTTPNEHLLPNTQCSCVLWLTEVPWMLTLCIVLDSHCFHKCGKRQGLLDCNRPRTIRGQVKEARFLLP